MKLNEHNNTEYVKTCRKCGTKNIVYTKENDEPEYYTVVYIHCSSCKNMLRFKLPVN